MNVGFGEGFFKSGLPRTVGTNGDGWVDRLNGKPKGGNKHPNCQAEKSALRATKEILFGESTYNTVTLGLNFFPSALLAINQNDDKSDLAALAFDRVDSGDRRVALSDDIVDNDNLIASFEISFNELGLAVALGSFADNKWLERGRRVFAK